MEQLDFKYQNYNVAAYKNGSGPIKILFLHGSGLDNAMLSWKEVMETLDEKKYTSFAIDYPGYGKSDPIIGGKAPDFYNFYNGVIEAAVDFFSLDNFVLCGLSMGGSFALNYAFAHQEKLRALVLTDPWGIAKKMPMHYISWLYLTKTDMMKTSYKWTGKSRALAKWSITYSLISDKSVVTDELVDEVWELCKADNAAVAMQDFQRNSVTKTGTVPYYSEELKTLRMPTLVINGEKDSLVNVKDAIKAANLIPNSTFHEMKGCKHWAQKERPEEFVQVIDDFISTIK